MDGGHVLYSSLDDNQFVGVGILVHVKHIKKSMRVHVISGRVLGLDVCINGTTFRAVATYLPHCGYDVEYFDETFDQIRCLVDQGQKKRRKINTQINVGYRGMQLYSFVNSFGLCIANNSDIPWDMQWTSESSMGTKRKIDYIFVSACLEILSAHGSKEINLGSEHRAVKSILRIQTLPRKRTRRGEAGDGAN